MPLGIFSVSGLTDLRNSQKLTFSLVMYLLIRAMEKRGEIIGPLVLNTWLKLNYKTGE